MKKPVDYVSPNTRLPRKARTTLQCALLDDRISHVVCRSHDGLVGYEFFLRDGFSFGGALPSSDFNRSFLLFNLREFSYYVKQINPSPDVQ